MGYLVWALIVWMIAVLSHEAAVVFVAASLVLWLVVKLAREIERGHRA